MPVFVSRTTTLLGFALLFQLLCASPHRPGAALAASPPSGPGSTTPTLGQAMQPSTAAQLGLVHHLRQAGAVFYGAWWCPACFKQKNLFGQEAGNQLPYQECEKTEEQRKRCDQSGIQAYPTWVMGSKRLEGLQTLEHLGEWSNYANPAQKP